MMITARRSNQSILKEISPEYSLEGLMLKLKLQYFGHPRQRTDSFRKDPDAGKDWGQEEKGGAEDGMVGETHQLNGHEFEQTLGDGEGQGGLVCCSPWGHKESDTTERLNDKILEWVAISFSRGSSWPRDRTWVSCIAGRFFTIWATWGLIR